MFAQYALFLGDQRILVTLLGNTESGISLPKCEAKLATLRLR